MLLYTQTIEDPRQARQFEDIYTACRGRLLALARRKLCGGAEAEDAVHQAFLALAEHFPRLCRLPRPQLEAYSRALERVLEKKVVRRALYFLAAGETMEI